MSTDGLLRGLTASSCLFGEGPLTGRRRRRLKSRPPRRTLARSIVAPRRSSRLRSSHRSWLRTARLHTALTCLSDQSSDGCGDATIVSVAL